MNEKYSNDPGQGNNNGHAHSNDDGKAQKYLELQMIQEQLDQIQKIFENIELQLQEIAEMTQSLDEFENVEDGSEILVPVVKGMFTKARLIGKSTMKVNIGSNVAVEKTIPEARQMLEQQMIEIAQYKEQLMMQQELLVRKAEQLGAKITRQ